MTVNGTTNGTTAPKAGDALPNAIDLSQHLNVLSRSRTTSPLKTIIKYMGMDGMISLAGGEIL